MDSKTVPIMIDDRKCISDFQMTRASYFYIEAVEPFEDIPLGETEFARSILTLEFSGVICRPLDESGLFDTAEKIETLFQAVERHGPLYVDSDNIWIPNEMFNRPPRRSDVFRVPFALFARLYILCRDDASLSSGIQQVSGGSPMIEFSEKESAGFREWTSGIVDESIAVYPKNRKLALTWSE